MARPVIYVTADSSNPFVSLDSGGSESAAALSSAVQDVGHRTGIPVLTTSASRIRARGLSDALSGSNYADAAGVVFEDALGAEADLLVRDWGGTGRPLPPLFGLVHDTGFGGYASPQVLFWHTEGLSRLRLFTALYVCSTTAQKNLFERGCLNVLRFAPLLASRGADRPRPTVTDEVNGNLHWIYGYSHADLYHAFVVLANALNSLVDLNRAASLNRDGNYDDCEYYRYYSPHLWRPTPEDVGLPRGLSRVQDADPVFVGHDHSESWARTAPNRDGCVVSFRADAQCDYRLLSLAHEGYKVFAPDSGVYRDALDPVCLYPPGWVDALSPDLPPQARTKIVESFAERLRALDDTWNERRALKRKDHTVVTGSIRPAVRASIASAPTMVVDSIVSLMGLSS